jgi:putative sugar O-methyltransferase
MDQELESMLRFSAEAPEVYRPSPFWSDLGAEHLAELEDGGFAEFKRSVATRYFSWKTLGIIRHQLHAVAGSWGRHPTATVFDAEFHDRSPFGPAGAWVYKTFLAMYADILLRRDPLALLETVPEPEVGHPFVVRHRGLDLTQDQCNSVHELYSILGPEPDAGASPSICEIGGGYGRLGFMFSKALPKSSYCIVDIPPSLYLSQRYLETVLPDEKVFRFRPFTRFEDVREEFESARIRFLAASQIELLPPKSFDYFVNVSSLHEMTMAQVKNYFRQMDRLCRGRVYSKQWRVSRAKVNGDVLREHEYPIPAHWRTIYQRRHPIQRMFFHALYEVGSEAPAST